MTYLKEIMTNVVLITVDCLRVDRVFNYHRYTTPILHELLDESIVYNSAYATGPYTTESVPGIIAAQHSFNGVHYGDDVTWKAIPETPTLASWLKREGYGTVATLTNPHLSQERNFDRGFEKFQNLRLDEETTNQKNENGDERFQFGSLLYGIRGRMRQYDSLVNPYTLPTMMYRYLQTVQGWPTVSGEDVVDAFKSDINEKDGNLFAWTHLMDLHAPLRPSTVRSGGLSAVSRTYSQLKCDTARAARLYEPRYDTMYDSALRYVDEQIGEIVNYLKDLGKWKETVLIVTGDHGEVLFDRQSIYGHPPHYHYDDLLHVPLIVRTPDEQSGVVDSPVSLAWLHQLIAELIDADKGDFPTESGRESLLCENEGGNRIVSDTIDNRGHTIAVRNGQEKIIHHVPVGQEPSIDYEYASKNVQFDYRVDRRERLPNFDATSSELVETAEELSRYPDELSSVGGEFSRTIEDRLHDLGYKM